jgi:HK97 family phage prohead protease
VSKKSFSLEIKSIKDEGGERIFSGYGSTFGNVDRVGDIVEAGAFSKSLEEHRSNGTMPSMLLHHDMHRPIGVWKSMQEDAHGLVVEGKLTAGVRDADEAYALLKDGALHSMSIGYRVVKEEYDRKSGVNHLHEIALHELSLVTIPANAAAIVGGVKNEDGTPDIRELERVLRDAGLSRREAKAFISEGFKSIAGEPVQDVAVTPDEVVAEKAALESIALAKAVEEARKSTIQDLMNVLGK